MTSKTDLDHSLEVNMIETGVKVLIDHITKEIKHHTDQETGVKAHIIAIVTGAKALMRKTAEIEASAGIEKARICFSAMNVKPYTH